MVYSNDAADLDKHGKFLPVKAPLEIMDESFKGLPELSYDPRDYRIAQPQAYKEAATDINAYRAFHTLIKGMLKAGTHQVDAAGLIVVRDALNADLKPLEKETGREIHALMCNIASAIEYAPPARARGRQPGPGNE
jgi:hypothetical protein